MEAQIQQPQVQPQPKFSRKQLIVLIASVLLVLSISTYYTVMYYQQQTLAQGLINDIKGHLEQDRYDEAHALLLNMEKLELGGHLNNTIKEVQQLLDAKVDNITQRIINNKEKNFDQFSSIAGISQLNNYAGAKESFGKFVKIRTEEFIQGKIDYEQLLFLYDVIVKIGYSGKELDENRTLADKCNASRLAYQKGQDLLLKGHYLGSLEQYAQVSAEDPENYKMAQSAIAQSLEQLYALTDKIGIQGQYTKALEQLNKALILFPTNEEIPKKVAALEQIRLEWEKNLVLYTGPVQHIFFHPLIAFPELTFDGDAQSRGFNEWFVTVPEFKKIIESVYTKGYILVNVGDLYEVKLENDQETIVPKPLYLPQGKKPMVISIDDLNFYNYMIKNGTVHKLIVDKQGKVATYSRTPGGEDLIGYDNEIIPILDEFVDKHPDFSFRGAKAVIALTGYEGILGYRSEPELAVYEEEKAKALEVVRALKDNGWTFASHSQGHPNIRDIDYDKVVRDTQRWLREVGTLIGPTEIYIYPFGAAVTPEDPKHKFLREEGFKVFCGVGPNPRLEITQQYILMDRRHIDGIALFWQADSVSDLFDAKEVLDPVRPILTK